MSESNEHNSQQFPAKIIIDGLADEKHMSNIRTLKLSIVKNLTVNKKKLLNTIHIINIL